MGNRRCYVARGAQPGPLAYFQDWTAGYDHHRRYARNGRPMPRRSLGARLYRDPSRNQYCIRDGGKFIRLGAASLAESEKYLAEYVASKHRPTPSEGPLVADILAAYATDVAATRKSAVNISYNIGNLLRWWGTKPASEITGRNCRAYAATKTAPAAAQDLKTLRAACNWWSKEYAQLVPAPVVWKPEEGRPRERWLTRRELAHLLRAAKRVPHLRRFICLAYYTGSRPGVVLRLQWDQIDLPQGVMARIRPGEAADAKKRAPPVRLGKRILSHLRRWERLDRGTETKYLCHYEGRPVEDPHASWARVTKAAGLPGVTRHTLRHTRATHLMQAGIDVWEAAGFLGMTVKTLEQTYAKHHPDWQEKAANV
jgi:integrase